MAQKRLWGSGRAWSAQWWWVVIALVGLGLAAWINSPLVARWFGGERQIATLAGTPPFRAGQRVLLLAPHPDDETLCCGGTVQQARAAGAEVFIAWMTAGDGFEFDAALTEHVLVPRPPNMRALGQTRAGEAERAAAVLGVPADHTFMLGYPDGGLFRLFTTNYATPLTAPRTQASRVYVTGALTPGHAFTGRNLETDLRRVLDRVRPDVAAGEYGYDIAYFERMSPAVDCLQADVTRCAGITEWLRVAAIAAGHGLEISGHCAPNLHAHAAAPAHPQVLESSRFALAPPRAGEVRVRFLLSPLSASRRAPHPVAD